MEHLCEVHRKCVDEGDRGAADSGGAPQLLSKCGHRRQSNSNFVYKLQSTHQGSRFRSASDNELHEYDIIQGQHNVATGYASDAVSYTHLTLPTKA